MKDIKTSLLIKDYQYNILIKMKAGAQNWEEL